MCVCVCVAVAALTFASLAAPLTSGHNAHDSLTQAYTMGVVSSDFQAEIWNDHCDDEYSVILPAVPAGCVFACSSYVEAPCISPFTAAAIVTEGSVRFGLDCWASMDDPFQDWTLRSTLSSASGTNGVCQKTFPRFQSSYGQFAETHWAHVHLITPGLPIHVGPYFMYNDAEFVGTSIDTSLVMRYHWFLTAINPAPTAQITDSDEDSYFDSNDPTVHQWNITDPGADDRLIQNGVDITPSIGSTVSLGLDLQITRDDAGSGNVIWRLKSTAANQYAVVDQAEASHGTREWRIYAVST